MKSDESGQASATSYASDLIYGSIAGVVGKFVEFPFDTIKVRLQTQPLVANSSLAPSFSGPVDVLIKTIRAEGFLGLYKGISAPLVGAMIENSGLFLCYNQIQSFVRYTWQIPSSQPLGLVELSTCGFFSGAIVSMVLTPVELVKCKLQVQGLNKHVPGGSDLVRPTYNGPVHVLKDILRKEGVAGFYRGHLGTFLRESGGGAAWFGTYEWVCKGMMERNGVTSKDDLTPWHLMGAGALAGMMFNFSLFPADVIKSRQQTMEAGSKSKAGFTDIAKEIYVNQGIKGFYRGCGITVARSAPTSGVIFMTYELLKRNLPL
ncbi:putative mitochondrial ornithine carrier protein [Chytriomyces cf. hyalinus JEL632]|nr:putative mitochondrial ornithine carrier protein [Chytriomyces cf. hyalinus JEL632]